MAGKKEIALKNLEKAGHLGRPKGCRNKFTNLKEGFLKAFEEIGGVKELATWAKKPENRGTFYKMLARMLPPANNQNISIEGEIKHPYGVIVVPPPILEVKEGDDLSRYLTEGRTEPDLDDTRD